MRLAVALRLRYHQFQVHMDFASRRYVRRILLFHGLLLVVVMALVAAASRSIFLSTREHSIAQAEARQQIIAKETATAIATFYQGVIDDLDMLRRANGEEAATQPTTESAGSPSLTRAGAAGIDLDLPPPPPRDGDFARQTPPDRSPPPSRASHAPGGAEPDRLADADRLNEARQGFRSLLFRQFAPLLWNQLSGRIVDLFVYDTQAPRGAINPTIVNTTRDHALVNAAAADAADWLSHVDGPSVSPLIGSQNVNLVCVPFALRRRLLVATVLPDEAVTPRLPAGQAGQTIGAIVADADMETVAATNRRFIHQNLLHVDEPDLAALVKAFVAHPVQRTVELDRPASADSPTLISRIVTVEPVEIAGRTWVVIVGSPLSEVDAVVNATFSHAILWAAFVVLSAAAILVSTVVQLIASRTRFERMRADLLAREVSQAREIQLSWLPDAADSGAMLDIAAVNQPATQISGDFYNWFPLPDGRTAVLIGDVTGHGMSAAFLMATTQLLVRSTLPRVNNGGKCLEEVNQQLCIQMFNGQFVTMLIAILDPVRHTMELATAGHPGPLIQTGGKFARLNLEPQLVLGVTSEEKYASQHLPLPPDATLLLYTDGVIETQGDAGYFGINGMLQSLAGAAEPQEMIDSVLAAVTAYRGNGDLEDDLTLVAIGVQKAPVEGGNAADPGRPRTAVSI